MKNTVLLLFFIILVTNLPAQKKMFLRIYDEHGNKIAKGFFAGTTDSTIILMQGSVTNEFPFSKIQSIKTRRSIGHNIALFTGVSTVVLSIIFVAASGGDSFISWSAGEGLAAGLIGGSIVGIFWGTITGVLKKSTTYPINRNYNDWMNAKIGLDKLPIYQQIEAPVQ